MKSSSAAAAAVAVVNPEISSVAFKLPNSFNVGICAYIIYFLKLILTYILLSRGDDEHAICTKTPAYVLL